MLAVVAFHEQLSGLPGGFLGVDLFFVISGYLITDVLAAPWDLGGQLDLRRFWIRRARRLLPCLAAVLVTVTAAVAVLEPDQLAALRPALLAAVTYTSNWWQASHHQSYFAVFGPPAPLQHLWSLAIEEQFYLIWPLVLTVILCAFRSRRARATAVWLGAAASAVAMTTEYAAGASPARLYYGADTHAAALLIGAGLALGWPLRRVAAASERDTRRLDLIGLVGVSVLGWEMAHMSGGGNAVYLGGLAVAALAGGAVVIAAAGQGSLAALLSWAPLRWIGVRSYGIYLWHWPVIALFAARAGAQSTGPGIRVAETAAAITLAAASWRWIEAPILRHGLFATLRGRRAAFSRSPATAWRSPHRVLPALIPLVAAGLVGTAGYGVFYSPPGQTLEQQIVAGARVSAASRTASGSTTSGHSGAGPPTGVRRGGNRPARPSSRDAAGRASGAGVTRRSPGPDISTTTPVQAARRAGPITAPLPRSVRNLGLEVTAIGDSVMLAAAPQIESALPGSYIDAQVSRQMSQGIAVAQQLAASGQLRPVVVVGLGTNGPITMAQVLMLRIVTGPRRALVFVTTFVPRPWQAEVNAVLAAASRQYRDVTLANWLAAIRSRTNLLWSDGVHPRRAGGVLYARIVASAVLQAAREAGNDAGAGQPGARPAGG